MEKHTTPYKTHLDQLKDFDQMVGKELGITDWTVIDQERIDVFANLTEDRQWIHTNPEKCAVESPYKITIAHGFLVLSLASKFSYEVLKIEDVTMGVNYGLDKVRFIQAVPSGSRIRGRINLVSLDHFPGGAKYKTQIIFELAGAEKPACVAEFIAMAYTVSLP